MDVTHAFLRDFAPTVGRAEGHVNVDRPIPIDHVFYFDSVVVLTYAAAVTTAIRLGVAVAVLPVHHPILVAHQ